MELSGKRVIVTGAAGNLGAACAREVARQGGKTVVADLPGTPVAAIVAEIQAAGGEAIAYEGDVSSEADVVAMVEAAKRAFGGVDALVNVAAAMNHVQDDYDLEAMTVDVWDRIMAVNLRGAMLGSKHVLPLMRAQGSGVIINFGSTAGLMGDVGLSAYSTTKAGLMGFSRAIATTYGKDGIRSNTVCPGSVWSQATKDFLGDKLDLMERTRMTPRLGVPEDIAHTVVFLCSDKASYITGQSFVVDGGGTAHQPWVRVS